MSLQDLNYPTELPSIELDVLQRIFSGEDLENQRSLVLHCGWVVAGYLQRLVLADPNPPEVIDPLSSEAAIAVLQTLRESDPISTADAVATWRWLHDVLDGEIHPSGG